MLRKTFLLLTLFLAMVWSAKAQNPDFVFGGIGFNSANTPNIFGFGGATKAITEELMSYSDWDANPQAGTVQFKLGNAVVPQFQFSARTGIAAKLPYTLIKGVSIWGFLSGGIASNGQTTGGSFGTGGFIDVAAGPSWGFIAILQAEKNAVTGTRFTPRFGVRYRLTK